LTNNGSAKGGVLSQLADVLIHSNGRPSKSGEAFFQDDLECVHWDSKKQSGRSQLKKKKIKREQPREGSACWNRNVAVGVFVDPPDGGQAPLFVHCIKEERFDVPECKVKEPCDKAKKKKKKSPT
jgi:hypothetical protein